LATGKNEPWQSRRPAIISVIPLRIPFRLLFPIRGALFHEFVPPGVHLFLNVSNERFVKVAVPSLPFEVLSYRLELFGLAAELPHTVFHLV
jgi:hypothetical protein